MANKSFITAFKVVSRYIVEDDYHSCSLERNNKYSITYKIGKITIPPIGGIFAFKTLRDAVRFCRGQGFEYILQGIGRVSRKKFYKKSRASLFSDGNIEKYWKKKLCRELLARIPTGTILLSQFMPNELIIGW